MSPVWSGPSAVRFFTRNRVGSYARILSPLVLVLVGSISRSPGYQQLRWYPPCPCPSSSAASWIPAATMYPCSWNSSAPSLRILSMRIRRTSSVEGGATVMNRAYLVMLVMLSNVRHVTIAVLLPRNVAPTNTQIPYPVYMLFVLLFLLSM